MPTRIPGRRGEKWLSGSSDSIFRGDTEAQPGHHDDRVIATAIAWQLRKRPRPQFRIGRA